MAFRSFRLAVAARTLLLVATCLLIVFAAAVLHLKITTVLLMVVLAIQVRDLIHYVERSNRDVTRFLTCVRQDDFTATFVDDGRGGSHAELRRELAEVLAAFRRIRAEREESFHYLNTIVQHIEVGLLAVTDDDVIELINPAARRLLGTGSVRALRDLERRSPGLAAAVSELRPGERSLLRLGRDLDGAELVMAATQLRIGSRSLKLISLHDIAQELDERELEAWQQMARVLSHEIANSIAPIASLAATARELLDELGVRDEGGDGDVPDTGPAADLVEVVDTIAQRSRGLVHFVDEYRRLTRLPTPKFRTVRLDGLLERVARLLMARPDAAGVRVSSRVQPDGLELTADPELVEQALLNIGINALQALQDHEGGRVEINAELGRGGRTVIRVSDNGPGISEGALGKIFVPFFTTKEGGSGIGLNLARQAIRLHGGDIGVGAGEGETTFTLRF